MARPVEKKAKNLGYTSITVRMSQETIERLDEYCNKKGVIRSEFIRELITKAVKD